MENCNHLLYLAPILAVLFFVALGILYYCYYRSHKNVDDESKQGNLQDSQLIAVETKERLHSAVSDYFVVKHPM